MAMDESEKLVISLAANLGKSAYDGLDSIYQQTKEELEKVKKERDEARYYANKWFKLQDLLGIEDKNLYGKNEDCIYD